MRFDSTGWSRGRGPWAICIVLCALGSLFAVSEADAQELSPALWRVLSLRDYNTRIVMLGTGLLGIACGVVGVFMVLRKKALLGDAISHATLPGIAIAFLLMSSAGGAGKSMPGLLLGAAVAGLCGAGWVLLIRSQTRLPEDTALGIVLSVFFGAGLSLLGIIQKMEAASAAGLESFIYGKTASMLAADGRRIALCAAILLAMILAFFKEFRALCFDAEFARVQGWSVRGLDALMMGMVVACTVIGLQAVGLILVIALLIIPPAAARFWTEDLMQMLILSALVGALAGILGTACSALYPHLPAGALVVMVAAVFFLLSLFFGRSRGIAHRALAHLRLERRIDRQNVLRALYEIAERHPAGYVVTEADLRAARHWGGRRLPRTLRRLCQEDLVRRMLSGWQLTADGLDTARRLARNHRLWELYLIHHAAVAPSHVDRDADFIEHVLGRAMVAELENLLGASEPEAPVPASPHPLPDSRGRAP